MLGSRGLRTHLLLEQEPERQRVGEDRAEHAVRPEGQPRDVVLFAAASRYRVSGTE